MYFFYFTHTHRLGGVDVHFVVFDISTFKITDHWPKGLTTLNKAKSGQVSTNNEIMTQNIVNVPVLTSVEVNKNTNKL